MTAFDSVAGGSAGESDAGETSNEHGRTGKREQDGSNVASVTYCKYADALAPLKLAKTRLKQHSQVWWEKYRVHLCERCIEGSVHKQCSSWWTAIQTYMA